MNPSPREPDVSEQIAALVETLQRTDQRLRELTAGEVDAVAGHHGHTFLLQHAQEELRLADATQQAAILDALPAHIAMLDPDGQVISVNVAWRKFADANSLHSPGHAVGANYLAVCEQARGSDAATAVSVAQGIRAVLAGQTDNFAIEYACHSPAEQRWFMMTVTPVGWSPPTGAVVMHLNITKRKEAESALRRNQSELQVLFNLMPAMIWFKDTQNGILRVNEQVAQAAGKSVAEIEGKSALEIYPRTAAKFFADDLEVIRSRAPKLEIIETLENRDGTEYWVQTDKVPYFDENHNVIGLVVMARDITERKQQELKILRLSRIRAVTGGISSAMLRLHDRDELLQEACRVAATEGVFPLAWISVLDPATGHFNVVASHGTESRSSELITALNGRETWPDEDRPSFRASHTARPVVINDLSTDPTIAPIRADLLARGYGSVAAFPLSVGTSVVGVMVLLACERDFFDAEEIALLQQLTADLSFALEHIQISQRLIYLAYYNSVTGLPNLQLFRDRLDQFVSAAQESRSKVCVQVIDLENFTMINNTFGRVVGDELLRQVGARFKEFLVEPYALAHVGADTFALASPLGEDIIATKLRDCMLDALKQPFSVEGNEISVTMQAGVAVFPADGSDGAKVFKNAELALKLAKDSGESYVYHSSEMTARVAERRSLEKQLRIALDAQQFVLHYQPKVDMISGEINGAEALIRWQSPDKGLVGPKEFITLAEETGLIVPIGSWVINSVCSQQAAWIAAGVRVVPIAVNLSSVQFEKGDILQTVRDALAQSSIDGKLLNLELTESAIMADATAAAVTLTALRKFGVRLALDDFGTGYSSLAHLKRFPFSSVKIDQSFVADITSNAEDAAIATAIIAMAHSLSLKVVAEGVETQGQFNYLRARGCDEMQGYFFSPAVATEVFESDLRSGRHMHLPPDSPADRRTLLLVDDEPGICNALARMLRRDGYRILIAASGAEGLAALAIHPVQVIISDQRMPGMSGTEFLDTVKQLYPTTIRILLSGYTDLETVTEAVNRGAVFKFLTKPWDDDLLREQVRDAFRRHVPESSHPSVAAIMP